MRERVGIRMAFSAALRLYPHTAEDEGTARRQAMRIMTDAYAKHKK
jgi:hypothetical protein